MIANPVPGSTRERNDGGYAADSGLDILVPTGTPCVACADGQILYSEPGHTPWLEDTDLSMPGYQGPHSVLLLLDEPFQAHRLTIRYAWYTHLTRVAYSVPDGGATRRVRAGEVIAWSGIGNRVPHLHFGLLSNRSQGAGQFLTDRQVADLVWPRGVQTAPVPPTKHDPAHRLKIFLNEGRTRAFRDGVEVAGAEVRVLRTATGQMHVWIDGDEVKPASVTVDIAHR